MDAGPGAAEQCSSSPADPDPHEPPTPKCSVKGCNRPKPLRASTRMCEECRGRHRIYAATKRAKRKQEKAAILAHMSGLSVAYPDAVFIPEEHSASHPQEMAVFPSQLPSLPAAGSPDVAIVSGSWLAVRSALV